VQKLIIEARVSGQRETNPHAPYSPEEIADAAVECWEKGASDRPGTGDSNLGRAEDLVGPVGARRWAMWAQGLSDRGQIPRRG
jgi:hypothetical protein